MLSGYFFTFLILTSCAMPVTGILMLAAGAIFGFSTGTLLTIFASTSGACLLFTLSRFLFQDSVKNFFPEQIATIDKGIANEGAYYLFSIRMMAVFPFFLINILSGLTSLTLKDYLKATLSAQIILCLLFSYAGERLGSINSWGDFLSMELMLVLALVGLSPLLIHRTFLYWRSRKSIL